MERYTKKLQEKWQGFRRKVIKKQEQTGAAVSQKSGIRGKKFLFYALSSVFFFLSLFVSYAPTQGASTAVAGTVGVMVMPFAIHSKDDISDFRRQVLNRIASDIEMKGKARIVGIERLKRIPLLTGVCWMQMTPSL